MDIDKAGILPEGLARMTVAIKGLKRNISETVHDEERQRFSHNLKELLKSCYNLPLELGKECPEIRPHFLGLEHFSTLRKSMKRLRTR